MLTRKDLSKFGMGTWGIGGFVNKDPNNNDQGQIAALCYMFDHGINFVETGLWAAEGHSAYLTAQAYKASNLDRGNVFLTQTVYPFTVDSISDIRNELARFSELFQTDYIDAFQFSKACINKLGYENTVELVKDLLDTKKIRYTSITNASLDFLKKYHSEFGDQLFANEVGFNFEIRENENLSITGYADANNILNVVYQPLRRNRTAKKNYPILVELSEKYRKTQNQIILNWIVSKDFLPITKSETIEHIDQHFSAFDFTIEPDDLHKIDNFRVSGYQSPKIDWDGTGKGVAVDQLSNVFDDLVK